MPSLSRTYLMGEAPARISEGVTKAAFSAKSGGNLSALIRMDVREAFRCVNLLDHWPGYSHGGKGSAFPRTAAQVAAERFIARRQNVRIILAGARLARAFRIHRDDVNFLCWDTLWGWTRPTAPPQFALRDDVHIAIIPHPSGLVRWWNEPGNREAARVFLLEELGVKDP